jgi:RHS repeat-associated protein
MDRLGNVTGYRKAITGIPAAQLDAVFDYDAFGQELRSGGFVADRVPWHFSTKFTDAESDYNYYGYRYFDSRRGRWLNRDPFEEETWINLQSYSGNNILNSFDILGLYVGEAGRTNCLGYACRVKTRDGRPSSYGPNRGESIEDIMKQAGYSCKGPTNKTCKCKGCRMAVVVYIYKYGDNPDKKDPFRDPWRQSPGQNDFHAVRGDGDGAGGFNWSEVTGYGELNSTPELTPHPTPDPKNPDSRYPKGRVPKLRYCCCKK